MQTPDIDLSHRLQDVLAFFEDLSPEERATLLASLPIHSSLGPVMSDLAPLQGSKLRRIRDLPSIEVSSDPAMLDYDSLSSPQNQNLQRTRDPASIDILANVLANPEFLTALPLHIDINQFLTTCTGRDINKTREDNTYPNRY